MKIETVDEWVSGQEMIQCGRDFLYAILFLASGTMLWLPHNRGYDFFSNNDLILGTSKILIYDKIYKLSIYMSLK